MTQEFNPVLEAKHSLKAHILFLEKLLEHLKGPNKILRNRAVWAAWCLHQYINNQFVNDIEEAIKKHAPKEDENVQ